MTVQETYNKIVKLTSEIVKTDIITETLLAKDSEALDKAFEKFKKENAKLWENIQNLNSEYNYDLVFASSEGHDGELFEYNPELIYPLSLFFLMVFAYKLDNDCLFERDEDFTDALRNRGLEKLAKYTEFKVVKGSYKEIFKEIFNL